MCMSTHSHRGTLTLNSKNSGLIKSSRNQVSGGFSQSAIALVNKTRKRWEGVNIHLCHTPNQYTDSSIWGLKKRGASWPRAINYKVTEKWSFLLSPWGKICSMRYKIKHEIEQYGKQLSTSTKQTPVVGLEIDHGEGQCSTRARHVYVYGVTLLESNYSHWKKLLLSCCKQINICICLVI